MAETIIEIKNLHKYFGKNKVLKGIDLDIKKGEVVVIIGPSGSGKSTFLRSMNLLETPTKGVISFEGVDITDKSNDIFKISLCHRLKLMVFLKLMLKLRLWSF